MPNGKTDINNHGGFSTDMIGMNYRYPEATYEEREHIVKAHEVYTKGLLYFTGHDPRVPVPIREEMLKWGYPKDEYTGNGHWSPQLYIREARRMKGEYVMTQANCQGKEIVKDGVGMAAYTMDSHNVQRLVVNGMVKNEGDVQVGGFGPYPISYRSLVPKKNECSNLLVPVCLSATHIAYGSIRMEPVFMVLAQSAAVAAGMAIDSKTAIQEIDVPKLQQILKTNPLADGSQPEILVDNADEAAVGKTGEWEIKKGGYGPTQLYAQKNASAAATVRFTPLIPRKGKYQVYYYFSQSKDIAAQTPLQVFDGKRIIDTMIKKETVQVEGQTSGTWVLLGEYWLPKGNRAYVEVSAAPGKGIVVADAVLLLEK
jgi:hypothetical protein